MTALPPSGLERDVAALLGLDPAPPPAPVPVEPRRRYAAPLALLLAASALGLVLPPATRPPRPVRTPLPESAVPAPPPAGDQAAFTIEPISVAPALAASTAKAIVGPRHRITPPARPTAGTTTAAIEPPFRTTAPSAATPPPATPPPDRLASVQAPDAPEPAAARSPARSPAESPPPAPSVERRLKVQRSVDAIRMLRRQ